MPNLRVRFHGDLNDFLSRDRRGVAFEVAFEGRPAIKDVLESLGVPHVEIDRVLANGAPVTLGWPALAGAEIDVFPRGEGPQLDPSMRLLPELAPDPRFVLDGHLGRLAAMLRMLGFDAEWAPQVDDAVLAARSAEDDRTLLTRDVGLLKRSLVRRGAFIRSTNPTEQLREVARRFELSSRARPFTRCLRCNAPLREVRKEAVESRLPPRVRERQTEFRECPSCHRLYWPGTHHERMTRLLRDLVGSAGA